MALFNRSASVQIDIDDERTTIANVRISFKCEKTNTTKKNSASIKIYNLSETTRDAINTEGAAITLLAGYLDDSGEEVLFIGDVVYINTQYVVPDLITEFELKDGGNALRDSRLNESFEAGTSAQDIMDKLASATGLPVKEITADLSESFANGFSVSGLVSDSMSTLLKKFGIEWTVTDGELQVIDKDASNSDPVIVLNPATGLIGLPSFLLNDKNVLPAAQNVNKKLTLTSLLIPKLNPTREIKVQSRVTEGNYRIDTVVHEGDTHGDLWASKIEATAL